jgi:hypothetical protein
MIRFTGPDPGCSPLAEQTENNVVLVHRAGCQVVNSENDKCASFMPFDLQTERYIKQDGSGDKLYLASSAPPSHLSRFVLKLRWATAA